MGSQGTIVPPEASAGKFVPREASELVKETFRVYRTGIRRFLLIALIPQTPLIPLSFVSQADLSAITIIAIVVSLILSTLAKGAMVCAVSQNYLEKSVKVDRCFGRAWAGGGLELGPSGSDIFFHDFRGISFQVTLSERSELRNLFPF